MVFGENLRGGLSEIWGHKLRSALTLTGIVLGTFSINAMFSIVQGVRNAISGVFETIGLDGSAFITPRGLERDERTAWNRASRGLSVEDAEAVAHLLGEEALVSPNATTMREVVRGTTRSWVQIEAVNETYFDVRNFDVDRGRLLVPADVEGSNPVAVLGYEVARDLFPNEEAVGKELPIEGLRFRVVGVLAKPDLPPGMHGGPGGGFFGASTVYVPISTARQYLVGPRPVVTMAIKAKRKGTMGAIVSRAENLLSNRHRNVPDFEVENVDEQMLREREEIDKMLLNFNIVLGSIAGTALLVGGIGILSLMLIAVNERLFEIGIRKAVGARDGEVMVQFLIESSTLTGIGAVVGTLLAVAAVKLLSSQFPFGLAVSVGGASLAAFFALATGIGFGLYPAWLASRLEPVDALRAA